MRSTIWIIWPMWAESNETEIQFIHKRFHWWPAFLHLVTFIVAKFFPKWGQWLWVNSLKPKTHIQPLALFCRGYLTSWTSTEVELWTWMSSPTPWWHSSRWASDSREYIYFRSRCWEGVGWISHTAIVLLTIVLLVGQFAPYWMAARPQRW